VNHAGRCWSWSSDRSTIVRHRCWPFQRRGSQDVSQALEVVPDRSCFGFLEIVADRWNDLEGRCNDQSVKCGFCSVSIPNGIRIPSLLSYETCDGVGHL
jgi:hypothetical protein